LQPLQPSKADIIHQGEEASRVGEAAMLTRTSAAALAATALEPIKHVLFVDAETYSELDVGLVSYAQYARHPSTRPLVVAYAVDDRPVKLWHPDDPVPAEIRRAAARPDWIAVAHSAGFDRTILAEILAPRSRWTIIPSARWRCTLASAVALAFPASLERLAEALGLEHTKDAEGARLMRLMTRPRRTKSGDVCRPDTRTDNPANMVRLDAYCARDVEAMREAYYRLPSMPPEEVELWLLDQTINARGIPIDRALAEAARDVTLKAKPAMNEELAGITGGAVTSVDQVARLKAWLVENGCPVDSLAKDDLADVLRGPVIGAPRRVLELRAAGAKNTAAKFGKMLAGLDTDDRLRDLLFYHAASTGRWSSRRVNIHNLARTPLKDPEPAIAAVMSRDLARIKALGPPPLVTLANIVRATICAPAGRTLLGADFSGIEARVLAWFAGERKKLQAFREFDRIGDPALDPYLVTACCMLGVPQGTFGAEAPERRLGKTSDLGFGYGGGVDAWRNFEPDPAHPLPDDEVEKFKMRWRRAHPAIVRWWYAISDAAVHAVARPGRVVRHGRIVFKQVEEHLYLKLPSGRLLCYPFACIEITSKGRKRIVAKDNAHGCWRDERIWYGKLAENIVSGTARDLLVAALHRIEAADFETIFHVHDELVVEVDENTAALDPFKDLMTVLPDWADGLPIAAKAWTACRYVKS
jgi:DNA polymerase